MEIHVPLIYHGNLPLLADRPQYQPFHRQAMSYYWEEVVLNSDTWGPHDLEKSDYLTDSIKQQQISYVWDRQS